MAELGQVTDPNATPVRETTVRESQVKEELVGYYARLCERNEADARRMFSTYSLKDANGEVPLPSQLRAGDALQVAENWKRRKEAALRGVFLMDLEAQRDPAFLGSNIRGLFERAQALGVCEYENQLREQSRF